jgi:hypothetical protein
MSAAVNACWALRYLKIKSGWRSNTIPQICYKRTLQKKIIEVLNEFKLILIWTINFQFCYETWELTLQHLIIFLKVDTLDIYPIGKIHKKIFSYMYIKSIEALNFCQSNILEIIKYTIFLLWQILSFKRFIYICNNVLIQS